MDIVTDNSKVWTYDDLVTIEQDERQGKKYEIFDGELVVTAAPRGTHQFVVGNLYRLLHAALAEPGIANVVPSPFDVILSKTRVVQPDLVVVRRGRASAYAGRGLIEPPDLAIEVLSPSNRSHDRIRKRRFYASAGFREYWIADPDEQSLEVLALVEDAKMYRAAGFYGPGELARSVQFEIGLSVDEAFAIPPL